MKLTELVVHQERRHVVATQTDTDVEQIVQPANHDRFISGKEHGNKPTLEQLVAIEKDVVHEPATSGGKHTKAEVGESEV